MLIAVDLDGIVAYLTLPIIRVVNRVWVEALKLLWWKQNEPLVASDLGEDVLLFIVVTG